MRAFSGEMEVEQFKFEAGELRVCPGFEAVSNVNDCPLSKLHLCGSFDPVGLAAPSEGAEAWRFSGLMKLEADVPFFDESNIGKKRNAARDKDGFRIADAEGAAAGEPVEEGWRQLAEGDFDVARERRGEHRFVQAGRAVTPHARSQGFDVLGGKGEADGVSVAAEAGKDVVSIGVDGG